MEHINLLCLFKFDIWWTGSYTFYNNVTRNWLFWDKILNSSYEYVWKDQNYIFRYIVFLVTVFRKKKYVTMSRL